jgi:hypothetical protein
MKIRHPGVWLLTFCALLATSVWFLQRTFDAASLARTIWVTYVASALLSLFMVSHRREARPGVISIVTTVAAAIVGGWVLEVVDVRWWVRLVLLALVAAPVMSVANAAFRGDVRRAQRRRDAHAAAIVEAILSGRRVEPYSLYLRPFVSTDRLMAQAFRSGMTVPVHLDVETVLARSLRDRAPLIGLGQPGEMDEGIARVMTPEDHWRDAVLALARTAEFIVMLPLSRPSTTWELKRIVESGLVGRTLFIMPEVPYQTPNGVWSFSETADRVFDSGVRRFDAQVHMLDLAKEWRDAREAARPLSLDLPPLAAIGALFTMDPDTGKTKEILPLGLSTLLRPIRYLRWSVGRLGLLRSDGHAAGEVERAFTEAVLLGGKTLEFALMRAADGMAVWGNTAVAVRLLQQAYDEGQPHAPLVRGYFAAIPALIKERVDNGDLTAVTRYIEFTRQLQQDAQLGSFVGRATLTRISEAAGKITTP